MSPIVVPTPNRARDPEEWGRGFGYSLAAHGFFAALFLMTGGGKKEGVQMQLTEINFIEKPVIEAPAVEIPAPGGGIPDAAPQATDPTPASTVVSFAGGAAPSSEPIAAPIINAPIMPLAETGTLGARKSALAPIMSNTTSLPVRKGPMEMPMPGGGRGRPGTPLSMTKADPNAVGTGGGPIGAPLSRASGTMGGAAAGGLKPIGGEGSVMAKPAKSPIETLKANPLEKESWGKKSSPFSLEGPLRYRKVLKMEMPPYPRWAEEKGVDASVSYRIWADPKGKVKDNMYLEKTSGYSELDALAKEALLKFKFVALPDNQAAEDEWGVATFQFRLTK